MTTPNHDSSVTPLRPIEVNADNFVIKQYKVKGKPAQVLIAATLEGQQPEKVLDDMLQKLKINKRIQIDQMANGKF
jgi:hypothetical protein